MNGDAYTLRAMQGQPLEGDVVDIHMHLGEHAGFCIPRWRDLELLVREMDRHGVRVGGVASIPGCLGGLCPGGNELVLEALRRWPERFFGWATVNPHYPQEALEELRRCHDAGCRGLKLHNSIGLDYGHENYRPLLEFAAERGLPVLLHTWGEELEALEGWFRAYPGLKWSLAHAGASKPAEYVRLARQYEGVYLDLCYSGSPRGLVEYFVEQGVGEKLMFSSDCYFMGLAQQLGRVVFARITPRQKAAILGGNARRFLGNLYPGPAG